MTKKTVEFGDFQTPLILAKEIVNLIQIIQKKCLNHQIIIEPSCGKGNFIRACIEAKLSYQKIIAWEINSD